MDRIRWASVSVHVYWQGKTFLVQIHKLGWVLLRSEAFPKSLKDPIDPFAGPILRTQKIDLTSEETND